VSPVGGRREDENRRAVSHGLSDVPNPRRLPTSPAQSPGAERDRLSQITLDPHRLGLWQTRTPRSAGIQHPHLAKGLPHRTDHRYVWPRTSPPRFQDRACLGPACLCL